MHRSLLKPVFRSGVPLPPVSSPADVAKRMAVFG